MYPLSFPSPYPKVKSCLCLCETSNQLFSLIQDLVVLKAANINVQQLVADVLHCFVAWNVDNSWYCRVL